MCCSSTLLLGMPEPYAGRPTWLPSESHAVLRTPVLQPRHDVLARRAEGCVSREADIGGQCQDGRVASASRMVVLGFGKFARADRIFALEAEKLLDMAAVAVDTRTRAQVVPVP